MVTMPPGAPVPGIGFVQPGQVFTAPDGFRLSRTFRPVNREAQDALKKAYPFEMDGKTPSEFPLVDMPAPAPVVEEGLTLKQLDEQSRGIAKKRAADRQ
jgi:hypothetical protein